MTIEIVGVSLFLVIILVGIFLVISRKRKKPEQERIIPLKAKVFGKIDKISEKSKFSQYIKDIKKLSKYREKDDKFERYIKKIFRDSVAFLKKSGIDLPTNKIFLIFKTTQYLELEKKQTTKTIAKEITKEPSTAFVIQSNFCNIMYVNVGFLLDNLDKGYPSFVLNLVNVYFHELLHSAYSDKSEEEIFDLECELLEEFLEIELPVEFKNI